MPLRAVQTIPTNAIKRAHILKQSARCAVRLTRSIHRRGAERNELFSLRLCGSNFPHPSAAPLKFFPAVTISFSRFIKSQLYFSLRGHGAGGSTARKVP